MQLLAEVWRTIDQPTLPVLWVNDGKTRDISSECFVVPRGLATLLSAAGLRETCVLRNAQDCDKRFV